MSATCRTFEMATVSCYGPLPGQRARDGVAEIVHPLTEPCGRDDDGLRSWKREHRRQVRLVGDDDAGSVTGFVQQPEVFIVQRLASIENQHDQLRHGPRLSGPPDALLFNRVV
jgi:hypothetical protein